MSRYFVGSGYTGTGSTSYGVYVDGDGDGHHRSLTQQVRGAATDYQWDGGGQNSNDLARALLWVTTGVEPDWRLYHLFKTEIVSSWPRHAGECWRISEEEIREWLRGVERDTVQMESAGQTQARLGQTRERDWKLKDFIRTFKRRT